MGKTLNRLLAPLALGTVLAISNPQPTFAQQEGIAIRIGRMSLAQAKGELGELNSRIDRIKETSNYTGTEYFNSVQELEGIIKYCDHREARYVANALLGKLLIENNPRTGIEFFEKCIFEYSELEKQYGTAYKELGKEVGERKIGGGWIQESRAHELALKSSFSEIDSTRVLKSHKLALSVNLGNQPLNKALTQMFYINNKNVKAGPYWYLMMEQFLNRSENLILSSPPGLRNHEEVFDNQIYLPVNNKTPSNWVPREPITHFPEISISINKQFYPKLILKNVDITDSPNGQGLFYYIKKEIDVGRMESTMGERFILWGPGLSMAWLSPDTATAIVYEVHVKPGKTIKDFLQAGGLNPFSWIYPQTKRGNDSILDALDK